MFPTSLRLIIFKIQNRADDYNLEHMWFKTVVERFALDFVKAGGGGFLPLKLLRKKRKQN